MSSDGKTHMAGVKSCTATGSAVTIILSGTTTGFNVFVRRAMTSIAYGTTAGKLTGSFTNYDKEV